MLEKIALWLIVLNAYDKRNILPKVECLTLADLPETNPKEIPL